MTWILGVNSTSMSLYIGGLLGTLDSAFCSVVEFVQTIRGNRPCRMNKCFKAEATNIEWEGVQSRSLPGLVRRQDRVPIVDAAMRQLKHCAWMHNRTRMVASSFLSKDLMIDWRRGERYFMDHLIIGGDFAFKFQPWRVGIWLPVRGWIPNRISASSIRCDKVSDSKATGMENTFVNGCPSYGIIQGNHAMRSTSEPNSRGRAGGGCGCGCREKWVPPTDRGACGESESGSGAGMVWYNSQEGS